MSFASLIQITESVQEKQQRNDKDVKHLKESVNTQEMLLGTQTKEAKELKKTTNHITLDLKATNDNIAKMPSKEDLTKLKNELINEVTIINVGLVSQYPIACNFRTFHFSLCIIISNLNIMIFELCVK